MIENIYDILKVNYFRFSFNTKTEIFLELFKIKQVEIESLVCLN